MPVDVGSAIGYLLLDTSKWESGLKSAKNGLRTFQDSTATAADKFAAVGSSLGSVGKTLTLGVTAPLVGLGASAIKTAASFESSMSQVQATMGVTKDSMSEVHGETVNTIDALESIAKEMGSKTAFSAKEAADALNYLALAGYSTEQQIDALPSVLTLAAAGGMDLAYASDLVTDSMSVLGLTTKDLDGYINQMAKTASSSNTSVSQLGEAVLVAGGQAKLCGMNTADLNTALGILADNGIKGSEGGTMLRNVLKNLYTPTDQAAKVMDELGIRTADSFGNLRDTQEVLQDLSKVLSGMTAEDRVKAMADIFDTRTIAGANALLKNCTDRWDELSTAIFNSGGAAKDMADTQLDNLQGQLTILKSGIEGAAIAFGNALLPMIKDVIGFVQKITDAVNNLSESQKQIIVKIAEVAAAIGPVLIIVGKISTIVSKLLPLLEGAGGLSGILTFLASASGPIGLVIAAVAALTAAFITDFGSIRETVSSVMESISTIISSVWEMIATIWNSNLLGIRSFVEEHLAAIEILFKDVLSIIESVFKVFADLFSGDWEALWEDIKTLVDNILNLIVDYILAFFNLVIKKILDWAVSLRDAFETAWSAAKQAVVDKWHEILDWFESVKEDPVGTILSIAEAMYQAGKDILQSLWEGIKSIWGDVKSWFEDKVEWIKDKVRFWDTESKKLNSSPVGVTDRSGGSYASGLSYVPKDMNVRVHEGESILTKQQRSSLFQQESKPQVFKFDLSIPLDGEVIAHSQYTFNTREGILRGDDLVTGGATT